MIYRARMLVQAGSKVILIYSYLRNALGQSFLSNLILLGLKNTKSPADTKVEWFYKKDLSKKVSVQHEKGIINKNYKYEMK